MRLRETRRRIHLPVCSIALAAASSLAAPHDVMSQVVDLAVTPTSMVTVGAVHDAAPFDDPDAVVGLVLFPDGAVAVARRLRSEVMIHDVEGRVERVLGAAPAERFTYVTGLALSGPDTVLVFDVPVRGSLRVSRFLRTGQRIGAEQIGVTDGLGATYQGTLSTGVPVASWTKATPINPRIEVSDSLRIGLFDRDTIPNVVATVSGIQRRGSPIHFSPHVVLSVVGDTIFYSNGLAGAVHAIRPDASPVRSFQLPFEAWDPSEAFARLEPELDAPGLNPDVYDLQAGVVVPTVSDMLPAPDGRLWVKRYDPATDSHSVGRLRTGGEWTIVNTQGTIEGRIRMPDGFRLLEIGVGRIAGVMRGPRGEHVAVFAISPARPAA